MSAAAEDTRLTEQVDFGRLWWAGLLAAAGAAAANALVYGLAVTLGIITPDVIIPNPRGPLTLAHTVVSSAVPDPSVPECLGRRRGAVVRHAPRHPRRPGAVRGDDGRDARDSRSHHCRRADDPGTSVDRH